MMLQYEATIKMRILTEKKIKTDMVYSCFLGLMVSFVKPSNIWVFFHFYALFQFEVKEFLTANETKKPYIILSAILDRGTTSRKFKDFLNSQAKTQYVIWRKDKYFN
jgi:hypothetical protein